jgi:hemerythrin-like domain-containing protein
MADPIAAWHQEHVQFNQLLAVLQQEMDGFHDGGNPDYQLMLDILGYLRDHGDCFHHPREDEAFKRLVACRPDRELPIARLLQEHRVIAHAGEALRNLLEQAAQDAVIRRSDIEVAAATYLVYYGNHIAKEEEDVLPDAARHLTPSDWQAVKEAATPVADPLFGPQPAQRLRDLRMRIAASAAQGGQAENTCLR